MAYNKRKIIDRVAVAKNLRELEKLFVKEPPDRNDNAHGKVGADDTGKLIRGGTRNGR